jgi:regulator of cell morphogenesis and NO signaling
MNTIELSDRMIVPFDSKSSYYETRAAGLVEFSELDINSMIDLIIKQYHLSARVDVVVIYDLAQKVFWRHSEKHPELAKLVEALFLFFDDLLFHLKNEEQILFPNIIQLSETKLHEGYFNYSTFGVIREYALTMQNEHKEVVQQFDFFRRLTNDYRTPEDGSILCQSLFSKMKEFESEMMQHIQLENDILFPKAILMDEN